ncbi:CBO0543 family protein [Cohnella sp. GCM10012308]|uniref:CBO0543 family protein n=1 Tax=Cohnella sp. GCM10012308 TaxID=3317329 RepID=UPI0036172640
MAANRLIESLVWILSALLLILFIPPDRRKEAALSFLFMQFIAWILGLTAVEMRFLSYPDRFFAAATRTNLTFEFCALPTISAIYNVRFPNDASRLLKIRYMLAFPTLMTALEWLISVHTSLIRYYSWNLWWTWISEFAVLLGGYWFYRWFFRVRASRRKTVRV